MTDLTKFLTEARAVGAKATPVKYSRCPHCLSTTPPHWTERSPSGDSCCSQCNRVSSNFQWTAFTEGVTEEQFTAFARNHWNEMLDLLERQHKQLALHKAPWCDNESDDELHKKLERQGKALEVVKNILQEFVDREDWPLSNVSSAALCEANAILAGKEEG